jgi:hypothetical protein
MRLPRAFLAGLLGFPLLAGAVVLAPAASAAGAVPGTVRSLTATPGVGYVNVHWVAPSTTTGLPAATAYDVVGAGCGLDGEPHRITATSVTLSGIADRCHVTVIVYAHAKNGDGPPAVTSATTKDAPTGAVHNLKAIVIDGAVRLRWAQPTLAGQSAPVGYTITATTGSKLLTTFTVPTLGSDIPRMPVHTTVTFVVTPVNRAGAGAPNVVSIIPGIKVNSVGPTHLTEVGGKAVNLQIRVQTAFAGINLGKDSIDVYAVKSTGLIRVSRIKTASNGIATYSARVLSPAKIVLRPSSHSVQGIMFRIAVP